MHLERHSIGKVGWLRAAVLGANDGIVSTASLVLGSPRRALRRRVFYWPGWPGWLRAPCRWQPANMFPFHRRRIANTRRSVRKKESWRQITRKRCRNWLRCTGSADWSRPWRAGRGTAYGEGCAGRSCPEELGLTQTNSARQLQAAIFSAFSFSAGALLPVIIAASAGNAGFPFVILATLFRWLFLAISPRLRECVTAEGNNKNHVLERNGYGFIHGGRFSRRSGDGLNDR